MEQEGTCELKITIRSPRSLWLEFILHFITFGIYTCFWFVFRVREINQLIKEKKYRPWLWFFVPITAISQPFALPKFIRELNQLASEANILPWKAWHGLWILSVLVLTVSSNVSNRIEIPPWSYYLLILLWSLLFVRLQAHINNIKVNLSDVELVGSERNYSKWEWAFVVPLFPLALAITIYGLVSSINPNKLESLTSGYVYLSPGQLYSFPIVGDGWFTVEIGTHSDGSAEVELSGPLNDMYFMVFRHGVEDSLNEIASWRTRQIKSEHSGVECTENRTFAKKKLSVISHITCNGLSFTDPVIQTASLIETDDGIFELYGRFSSARISYFRHVRDVKLMAEGFEPL